MKKEIELLQKHLKDNNLYGYIAFSSDDHGSEYIVDYFKSRQFLSGFTGSAGTLLVTQDAAYLWTDGRYFIQAEIELKDSGIQLMKMRQKGVPTLLSFLKENMQKKETICFDGTVASYQFVATLKKEIPYIQFQIHDDILEKLWSNRPALPCQKTYVIEKQAGKTVSEKIKEVQETISTDHFLLSSLDDIAWLLNMRGNDIFANPVFLSFFYMSKEKSILFIDRKKLTKASREHLSSYHIEIRPYHKIYSFTKQLKGSVTLDPAKTNYALFSSIQNCAIVLQTNPTVLLKAVKNEVEIENIKQSHLVDAIAMIRFLSYLKRNIGKKEMSELSETKRLWQYRKQNKTFLDVSFETICAYKEHAALMHYSADNHSNATLKKEGMLLIDSGGQYLYGTTDITRTIVLGPISPEEKFYFTKALKAHIDLAMAKFLNDTPGASLDILARNPLWQVHMDYRCGTGHGIGYLLNVHEGPNAFRYNYAPAILKPGMITTNEPGVYQENAFGIRHENELLTVVDTENEYGTFLKFEPLTYVPFDKDGIDISLLNKEEIDYLNQYHQMIYEKVSPYLNKVDTLWLKKATEELKYGQH